MATGLVENLEKRFDNFECPVCMEEFVDPRVLTCLHSYCKRCLERLVKREGQKYSIKCPECRKETEVRRVIFAPRQVLSKRVKSVIHLLYFSACSSNIMRPYLQYSDRDCGATLRLGGGGGGGGGHH